MNIEKREIAWKGLTLRSADDAGASTVEGVAVPFGDIIDTWDGAETFDRDCSFDGLDEAKLCFEHGETIGRITNAESTDDGLHITARISDTARGRDAMTLIRDGVLDSFSVGFVPIESQKDRDGITHRRKVRLLETSIVSWPAYQNAKMTKSAAPAVEHRKETMENNNELMDLIQSVQEEQRGIKAEITKMGAKPEPAAIGAAYRSHGEYMQALARGDEQAMTVMKECRDLISTKDTGNTATWIADDLKLIEERRKVSQLLTHDTLPATGMSMEYHVVTSDGTAAGKQTEEGADLSFGKISFGTKTADINTYGGYTTLSRQTIERSTTPMLNTAITALQNAYAKATEKAVRDHLYAEIKAQRDASKDANKIDAPQLANMTIDDWVSLIIDASELADDRKRVADPPRGLQGRAQGAGGAQGHRRPFLQPQRRRVGHHRKFRPDRRGRHVHARPCRAAAERRCRAGQLHRPGRRDRLGVRRPRTADGRERDRPDKLLQRLRIHGRGHDLCRRPDSGEVRHGMMIADNILLQRLRDEVGVPAGEDERLTVKLAAAKRYVAHAVGTATVDDDLLADCIVSCAADLFNMRDARLGVMDVGDSTVEPFRISTDPLRSVWPKLRAAGVLTGGMVIA